MKKIFTFLFAGLGFSCFAQSTTVVISQVYGGGGATAGTPAYKYDYVELHNRSLVDQNISNFSLQYGSATGQFASSATNLYVFPANTIIGPGKYLLVQLGSVGSVGGDFPVSPDFISSNLSMSANNGKVALTNVSSSLACGATATPCAIPTSSIIDIVSYGTANNAEGGTAIAALTNIQAAVRKNSGNMDTDNNVNDFTVVDNPIPRNLNSNAVLPLNLLNFSVTSKLNSATLTWESANEINVNEYEIEKSEDGYLFSKKGSVKAKNGSSNYYAFTDYLLSQKSYYRLKMVDMDGSFKLSNVVTVNSTSTKTLNVYRENDDLWVVHSKSENGTTLSLFDLAGKKLLSENPELNSQKTKMNIADLNKGLYILVLSDAGKQESLKVIL